MADEKELQEKMLMYRTLESRLEVLARQRELVSNRIMEISATIASIEEIGKNKENVLFKLGGEAYTQGKITDRNNILVEIGAGIILEKPAEDGKQTLNKRREEMENAVKEIQNNIIQISNAINQLAPEINKLIQNSQMSAAG